MSKDTGGQAFPRQSWEYDGQNKVLQYQEEGMSLRDYYAARAMGELINSYNRNNGGAPFSSDSPQEIAGYAYLYADAMLKARNG